MSKTEWFASWFDTEYYHTLYKHRDHEEASRFIGNLVSFLELNKGDKVLDLACGKGRHSITLHEFGLDVLGVDLSENSITHARDLAPEGLHFKVHDMREVIPRARFHVIFNLFTSFGYFDDKADNSRVVKSMNAMLDKDGIVLIDFMNVHKVIAGLVPAEEKTIDGINFKIRREFDGKHIIKHIEFADEGKAYHYTESVQALELDDFKELLTKNGFELIRTFGDFDLNEYKENESDRLIIVARKKA